MSEALLSFAHTLADATGAIIRPYFGTALTVETKTDHSPVSIADREAEAAMRALITAHFPDHAIFGEEYGTHEIGDVSPTYTWVLDPIDGTRAFLAGKKEWGTLIALCEDGLPILGILDQPVTRERWVGMRGRASTHHGLNITTRACEGLAYATVSTTSADHFTPPQARHFVALAEACRETIADGDCYAYGLLAKGARDIVVDAGLKPYDILALVPIIHGAGGTLTAWDGGAISLTHFSTAVAAGNAALHAQARKLLSRDA